MSNEENPKLDDELGLRVPGEVGHGDPLADTTEVISQAIPTGVDRRTFLMRSAVVGATAVMTGKLISAQERTGRSIAVPPASAKTGPAPPLSKDLNVVKKGQGPVMTTIDEFYKVGPGPSSSHTIGPMRITYDFYQRASKLPADKLALTSNAPLTFVHFLIV